MRKWVFDGRDAFGLVGLALLCYGVAQYDIALAWIVAGAACLLLAAAGAYFSWRRGP